MSYRRSIRQRHPAHPASDDEDELGVIEYIKLEDHETTFKLPSDFSAQIQAAIEAHNAAAKRNEDRVLNMLTDEIPRYSEVPLPAPVTDCDTMTVFWGSSLGDSDGQPVLQVFDFNPDTAIFLRSEDAAKGTNDTLTAFNSVAARTARLKRDFAFRQAMDQGISHMRSEYFRDLDAPKQVDEELDQILKLGSDAIKAGGRVLTDLITHRGVDLSRWTVSISQDGRDVVLTRPDSQMQLAATPPTGSMANLTGIKFPLVVSGRKSVLAPESALPSSTAAEPDALSWPYIQLPRATALQWDPFRRRRQGGRDVPVRPQRRDRRGQRESARGGGWCARYCLRPGREGGPRQEHLSRSKSPLIFVLNVCGAHALSSILCVDTLLVHSVLTTAALLSCPSTPCSIHLQAISPAEHLCKRTTCPSPAPPIPPKHSDPRWPPARPPWAYKTTRPHYTPSDPATP